MGHASSKSSTLSTLSRWPTVISSAYNREDLILDCWPLGHHLCIAGPHHQVSRRNQCPVAPTVVFEVAWTVMPGASVEFQNESFTHHHVDPADPADLNLGLQSHIPLPQSEPRKGLDAGLTGGVEARKESLPARGLSTDFLHSRNPDETAVHRRIDGDHGRLNIETPDRS